MSFRDFHLPPASSPRRVAPRRAKNRGSVLIVTMSVLLILAAFVLVFAREMRIEAIASANFVASSQAGAIEQAAEQFIIAELVDQKEDVFTLPEQTFAGVQVGDGYFWLVRPDYDDDTLPTFGLVAESAKVNINTAGANELSLLPGLDIDIANSIVEWHAVPPSGIDESYYNSLPEPYSTKAGDFDSVEELLLIRGMNRDLLYGAPASAGAMVIDPSLTRGIYDLVTRRSRPVPAGTGTPPVDVNSTTSGTQFRIVLTSNLPGNGTAIYNRWVARPRGTRFSSTLDFASQMGLTPEDFDTIADLIVAGTATPPIQININQAPRDVLLCITGITDSDVAEIQAHRSSVSASSTGIGWMLTTFGTRVRGIGGIGQYFTGHTYQYSADIVAVSGNGRAFKRCRVIVDNTGTTPKVVFRRDITDKGWPLADEILTSLRQGQGLPPIATSPQARRSI